jgi:crotonobetainyl-CoA:carnitine CoA-transferase CaiB-like acyl-CoA transferase
MLALEGIRVVDLSRAAPGPYATMLLGDMGADVLLVEEAASPSGRRTGAPAAEATEEAAARNALRRNKRSIRLDLKHPEGKAIFRKLTATADVLVEGFRAGVTARLGIDYATLRTDNPRLVYLSLSGYGQDGPYAGFAGHDIDYIAVAGVLSLIGRPGDKPAIPVNLIADYAGGGLMAAFAIAVALLARERTGEGQYIDLAMTDGCLSLLTRAASQRLSGGPPPARGRDRLTGGLPNYDVYECKDGRYLAVGSLEPYFLAALCQAIGLPELAGIGEGASEHDKEQARERFRARFLERTRDEWFELLRKTDTCAAPVLDLDEALRDPHNLHRGMLVEVEHPTLGKIPQVGIAPKLSATPGRVRSAGPRAGADTDAVLRELGYGDDDIARLRESHVVA